MPVISPSISQIHYLSQHFYESSLILSDKCRDIESKSYDEYAASLFKEHRACFFGSIFNSVTFLEAYINEIYFNIADTAETPLDIGIPKNKCKIIKELWIEEIPRTASYPILKKYQILLSLCEKPKFNTGVNPYQNVFFLTRLRNQLIHYEPEWINIKGPSKKMKIHEIEKALKNKFATNPFTKETDSFFPLKIISYGCTEWALKNIHEFIQAFELKFS